MAFVNPIQHVQGLANGRSNRFASVDELALLADVFVQIVQEFFRYFDTYLGHIRGFFRDDYNIIGRQIAYSDCIYPE